MRQMTQEELTAAYEIRRRTGDHSATFNKLFTGALVRLHPDASAETAPGLPGESYIAHTPSGDVPVNDEELFAEIVRWAYEK